MPACDFRFYAATELGDDGYPAAWHATIKYEVREQAGHRCVRCHHPYRVGEHGKGDWTRCDYRCDHGSPLRARHIFADDTGWLDITDVARAGDLVMSLDPPVFVEAAWRILTVHHLDGDKANCCWWNLTALCQRCHLEIQGRVRMERRWPHEHSDWFKVYVAGFYAWSFLGENLTRVETEARLDELLALEDRQLALGEA